MLKKTNRDKILQLFFDNPLPETPFQLREISRKAKLAPKSVKNYLDELEKENLIIRKKHCVHGYPLYVANRDNDYFKFLKSQNLVVRIQECGLLKYLEETCMPDVIILFGSASRGEDLEDSDVDMFLLCKETKVSLDKYGRVINRKVSVFFSDSFIKLSNELKNNLINGRILSGYLKVY